MVCLWSVCFWLHEGSNVNKNEPMFVIWFQVTRTLRRRWITPRFTFTIQPTASEITPGASSSSSLTALLLETLSKPSRWNIYRPQRSCGQGNIFTPVCHSFCSQGGVGGLPQCMLGYHPPGSRHPPPGADTPLGADTPWSRPPRSRHPPPREQTPPTRERGVIDSHVYELRHLVGRTFTSDLFGNSFITVVRENFF